MNAEPILPTTQEDEQLFASLRAGAWDEFFGQPEIKESLQIAIHAAKQRREAIDHTLLYGPPGLGKTTLSHLIAKEMGSTLRVTSGTALAKVGDLAAILTNLQSGDVLFIDEIHRLSKSITEALYPVMEDFALDIVLGQGPAAHTIRLDLPKFTLVGATTRLGMLTGPFRDRFGVVHRLEYYEPKNLAIILLQAAQKLQVGIDEPAALEIARRSRGTPRVALKLLRRARDYAQVKGTGAITADSVARALNLLHVDTLGLDDNDRRYVQTLMRKYEGGPAGVSTIATALSEDSGTLEEVVEPYLTQVGFIKRTPQGRVLTKLAYAHFAETPPEHI